MKSETELENLIFNLHNEYLENEICNNKKNILIAYNNLIESTIDVNWTDYTPKLYEKYNTLIDCIDHHLTRW